jgi:hypothetical protein
MAASAVVMAVKLKNARWVIAAILGAEVRCRGN